MALEGEQLGFLEKTLKLIEKYGLFKIFKALCVIALFVYVMCNGATIVENIVQKVTKETLHDENVEEDRMHDIAMERRQEIKPLIDNILMSTLNQLNADRVFIIEMHNGTNNTSGLPFLYGEMTYETVADNISHVDDDYVNFSLSRFTFPSYIERERIWVGSIEEFKQIDSKLAQRLMSNDVSYIAISPIHGVKNELGFFGITYCNGKEPKSQQVILTKLMEDTQKLSTLLDSNTLFEETQESEE